MCGCFAFSTDDNGGQPVKTRELYWNLSKSYGEDCVQYVETKGWKKHPVKLFCGFWRKLRRKQSVIMLPAHNGLLVFSWLLILSKILLRTKIYYSVIGGWLIERMNQRPFLKRLLKHFDGIWVETESMYKGLSELGFNNVTIVPNFKSIPILRVDDVKKDFVKPYPLCIFSRIVFEKGVEDAINAVSNINSKCGLTFTLDLYGPIDSNYAERFEMLRKNFPTSIRYLGNVPPETSVETIKNYYALLFPTHFFTEGIPGTIIDAYAAGVPVIAPLWQNHKNVFFEGVTGWGYEFGKYSELETMLEKANDEPETLIAMRYNCIKVAEKFSPATVMKQINELLN